MIGRWGCSACGRGVPNDHMGPCPRCGGKITRIMTSALTDDTGSISTSGASIRPVYRSHAARGAHILRAAG